MGPGSRPSWDTKLAQYELHEKEDDCIAKGALGAYLMSYARANLFLPRPRVADYKQRVTCDILCLGVCMLANIKCGRGKTSVHTCRGRFTKRTKINAINFVAVLARRVQPPC
jgi:hypothetical protein